MTNENDEFLGTPRMRPVYERLRQICEEMGVPYSAFVREGDPWWGEFEEAQEEQRALYRAWFQKNVIEKTLKDLFDGRNYPGTEGSESVPALLGTDTEEPKAFHVPIQDGADG